MSDTSKIKNLRYFEFYSKAAGACTNCPIFLKCKSYDSATCPFSSVLWDFLDALCEADEALDKAIKYSEEYSLEQSLKTPKKEITKI